MNKVYKLFKQKIGCGHSRSFLFTEDEILDDKFFDKETAEKAKSDLKQSHKDGQFYFWTFRISEEWETVKSDLYMAANL